MTNTYVPYEQHILSDAIYPLKLIDNIHNFKYTIQSVEGIRTPLIFMINLLANMNIPVIYFDQHLRIEQLHKNFYVFGIKQIHQNITILNSIDDIPKSFNGVIVTDNVGSCTYYLLKYTDSPTHIIITFSAIGAYEKLCQSYQNLPYIHVEEH